MKDLISKKNSQYIGLSKHHFYPALLERKPLGSKPTVVEELANTDLEEGNDLCLAAKVCGSPEPDVKWLKDKKSIAENYRTKFEKRKDGEFRLLIKKAKGLDSGDYSLVATNSMGEVSSRANVKIKPPKR